jgi:hypothetical protein
MKKSELKEMIKATMSGGEVPGMRPFDLKKPARIAEFILALDNLLDEYHAELYLSDDVFAAIDAAKAAAKEAINLNEAEEEVDAEEVDVKADDAEVETTDVETTAEVDPNVKAVQDSLTQAQAAAQALGDVKLTDQIGNTITFFTRQHVASSDATVSEISVSPNSAGDDSEGVEDVNVDDPAKDAMVGLTETLRWKRIAGIAKDNGLYSTLKEGYSPGQGWTEDFSYDDMLAHGLTLTADTPLEDLQNVVDDFEDVNYHREAAPLFDAIDAINAGNRGEAKMYINKFHKEIQNTLAKF